MSSDVREVMKNILATLCHMRKKNRKMSHVTVSNWKFKY